MENKRKKTSWKINELKSRNKMVRINVNRSTITKYRKCILYVQNKFKQQLT